ncbi:MAG: acetyl-coenzyme A synthetase N-terminal domain-containing protein, partial [Shimia sp.]|uniref:acetyl-coenzyme A synthetase N-terminal domain-containing protein n=1 Tax=Shimia sp. TaxID=1954381 RepID=UPI0040588972
MSPDTIATHPFAPTGDWVKDAHITADRYDAMYTASMQDPVAFWGEHGQRVEWIKPFTKVKNASFEPGNIDIKWFEDGTLNVSAN